ncbi:PAS domain S-box protein, partial [Mesorhizobium sp. M5C.F.Ca.IN.020.14.1.1]
MVTESAIGETESAESVDAIGPEAPRRQHIAAPPLAPELPAANREGLPFLTLVAIVMLAGLSHLTGAPIVITVGLLATGMAGLAVHLRARRTVRRTVAILGETAARSRAEVETLADRMWEMQESEERFRGLIDALGDLVVHRDRDGHIVYANKVFADLVGADQRDLAGRALAELGIDVGIVPDAAFSVHECLSSTDVAISTPIGPRWFSWIELSVRDKESGAVSH